MKGKLILICCSVALLTSCVSALHLHGIVDKIDVIVINDSKPTLSIDSLVKPIDFKKLQAISDKILAEREISYATYFQTEKVFTKREKSFLLLNNISLYNDKTPPRNKNDTVSTKQLNIILCVLLLNHERPHIRSPGYYI
jgi:hypothetical protein